MKMKFFATLAAFMLLTLTGCGSSNSNPSPLFVTEILSDSRVDGDIQLDSISGFNVAQGSFETRERVFAGLDPLIDLEYRAFLHFPLTGVPGDAIIESAFLDIFIDDIVARSLTDTIPLRIDLVSFQPPLIETDFDRTVLSPLLSISVSPPISLADLDQHVVIDVTPLMDEAQRLGLADFQIRIMEDFGFVTPGYIEINNTIGANRSILAPLLTVTYF